MHPIWKQYITKPSKVLLAKSEEADLFKNNLLKGNAREDFISSFLLDFLPESMGVSSGEIFDRQDRRSPQIDVIVYDKSTPTMRIDNSSARLFPIDSVVAAIEVKTELNASTLKDSLDKFGIVSAMGVRASLKRFKPMDGSEISKLTPTDQDWDWLYPGTYIFGYSGYKKNANDMVDTVVKWYCANTSNVLAIASKRLALPRVVATPTAFLMRNRDDLRFTSGPIDQQAEYHFASCVSAQSITMFVADLLTKVLSRTEFVRLDLRNMREWIPSISDQIDITKLDCKPEGEWILGNFEIFEQKKT